MTDDPEPTSSEGELTSLEFSVEASDLSARMFIEGSERRLGVRAAVPRYSDPSLGRNVISLISRRDTDDAAADAIEQRQPLAVAPLSKASRERLKLRSAFLSGLGSNIIATGTLGCILAFTFSDKFTGNQSFLAAALALLCFFGGFGLHFLAEAILQGTDE